MRRFGSVAAVALLIAGCGAPHAAPLAGEVRGAAGGEARALETYSAYVAAKAENEGRLSLGFKSRSLMGRTHESDSLVVHVEGGDSPAFSDVFLGQNGGLYVQGSYKVVEGGKAAKTVSGWFRVGSFKASQAPKAGDAVPHKLEGGSKLKMQWKNLSNNSNQFMILQLGAKAAVPVEKTPELF